MEQAICLECKHEFPRTRSNQVRCSKRCRDIASRRTRQAKIKEALALLNRQGGTK